MHLRDSALLMPLVTTPIHLVRDTSPVTQLIHRLRYPVPVAAPCRSFSPSHCMALSIADIVGMDGSSILTVHIIMPQHLDF